MTDVELDERITVLEENDGGGNSVNGKTIGLFNTMYGPPNIFYAFLQVRKSRCLNFGYCSI